MVLHAPPAVPLTALAAGQSPAALQPQVVELRHKAPRVLLPQSEQNDAWPHALAEPPMTQVPTPGVLPCWQQKVPPHMASPPAVPQDWLQAFITQLGEPPLHTVHRPPPPPQATLLVPTVQVPLVMPAAMPQQPPLHG